MPGATPLLHALPLAGLPEFYGAPASEMRRVQADALGLDNLSYVLRAPVFARKIAGKDGRLYYGEGLVTSREDLGIIDLGIGFPYASVEEKVRTYDERLPKGGFVFRPRSSGVSFRGGAGGIRIVGRFLNCA